ncbi:MAG: ImmA/IrrE family metallo-endopeptidase [Gluconobacter albidus]
MSKALINKDIVSWALRRAGVSEAELADRLNIREEKVASWTLGNDHPTFIQAQTAAKVLGIPFGYFYLQKPPEEDLPLMDFRTVGSVERNLDVNTKNLLQDILYKRDWFKEYRVQQGYEKVSFIGSASQDMPPELVAKMISQTLSLGPRPQKGTFEEYLKFLVAQAENAGIWVMRTSMVGNNTHRPLSVNMFRGVAISDSVVPLILINSRDVKSAQIFTLAHELAHLWLGESGISNVDLGAPRPARVSGIEAFCNKVAAEILTPRNEFLEHWRRYISLDEQVDELAGMFKVSRVVIARRALDCRLINYEEYSTFYQREQARWDHEAEKRKDKSGSVPQHVMLPIRYGRSFTRSVLTEAARGSMLLREAASLLGAKPSKMKAIYNKLQA